MSGTALLRRSRHDVRGCAIRFMFQRIIRTPDFQARLRRRTRDVRLLHGVGKFMGEQPLPGCVMRPVLAGPKHDICANGVGARVDGMRRRAGACVCMHANMAEIVAETRFHSASGRHVERLAR